MLVRNHVFRINSNLVISNPGGQEVSSGSLLTLVPDHSLQGLPRFLLINIPQLSSERLVLIGQFLRRIAAEALFWSCNLDHELWWSEQCFAWDDPRLQLIFCWLLPQTQQTVPNEPNQEVNILNNLSSCWHWWSLLLVFIFVLIDNYWRLPCLSPSLDSEWWLCHDDVLDTDSTVDTVALCLWVLWPRHCSDSWSHRTRYVYMEELVYTDNRSSCMYFMKKIINIMNKSNMFHKIPRCCETYHIDCRNTWCVDEQICHVSWDYLIM